MTLYLSFLKHWLAEKRKASRNLWWRCFNIQALLPSPTLSSPERRNRGTLSGKLHWDLLIWRGGVRRKPRRRDGRSAFPTTQWFLDRQMVSIQDRGSQGRRKEHDCALAKPTNSTYKRAFPHTRQVWDKEPGEAFVGPLPIGYRQIQGENIFLPSVKWKANEGSRGARNHRSQE